MPSHLLKLVLCSCFPLLFFRESILLDICPFLFFWGTSATAGRHFRLTRASHFGYSGFLSHRHSFSLLKKVSRTGVDPHPHLPLSPGWGEPGGGRTCGRAIAERAVAQLIESEHWLQSLRRRNPRVRGDPSILDVVGIHGRRTNRKPPPPWLWWVIDSWSH